MNLLSSAGADFAIILLALAHSQLLLRRRVETLDKKRAIVSLLVIAFASLLVVAEGIAFPQMDAVANAALPASFPPALGALPGLLFFISLSLLAFWEVVRFPEPERNAEPTPAALALVPAAPLMVILVGAAAAVLPHFQIQSAIEATLVLGSTAALLTLAGIRYRRAASPRVGIGVRADRWRQGMESSLRSGRSSFRQATLLSWAMEVP